MKHKLTFTLAATSVVAMLTFTNCKKDLQTEPQMQETTVQANASNNAARTIDRVDQIMGDLSLDKYSLSFSNTAPTVGITRTAYGADNYLVFADPQDVICPEPIRYQIKKVPIYKRPNFIVPTCPDMSIDIIRLKELQDLIVKADPVQYKGLQQIQLLSGGGMLATPKFASQFTNLKSDKVDGLTQGLSPEKFIMLGAPDIAKGGIFARNFYGWADLNSIIFKPYRTNLRDIIKPTLKGCFDPLILKTIRERLVAINPALYKSLTVTPLQQNAAIGVLSY